ncbi:MAG: YdcF family protein [Thermanaerothrix sp.]|nr:YdcF family protein [Thermanaerothrix sp.]
MSKIFFAYKLLGSLVVPPGLFILLCFAMAAAALRPPRRLGLALTAAVTGMLIYSASCDWSSRIITGSLENMYLPQGTKLPEGDAVIVVLGGGVRYEQDLTPFEMGTYTAARVLAAQRLAAKTGWPVLCCGGNPRSDPDPSLSEARLMADTLRDMGIERVYEEGRSRTTMENLSNAYPMLKSLGVRNVVLVTSAFHMPRSLYAARKALKGFQVYPYPAGRLTDRSPLDPMSLLPNQTAMATSALGLREWVGIGHYKVLSLFSRSPEER